MTTKKKAINLFPLGVSKGHDPQGYIATCNKTKQNARSEWSEGIDVAVDKLTKIIKQEGGMGSKSLETDV